LCGRGERTQTFDLSVPNRARYQLRHTPMVYVTIVNVLRIFTKDQTERAGKPACPQNLHVSAELILKGSLAYSHWLYSQLRHTPMVYIDNKLY
jgi:hypothetical protein